MGAATRIGLAPGVAVDNGSLLAQAKAGSPAAKRHPAVRTATLQLGGHRVRAVPLGLPDSKGRTLYEVSWRGVTVQAPLTGQLGAAQFKPGSWLKGALERAYEARQGPACPVSEAPVLGSNGRPAHVRREGLSASFFDGAGSTTTVRLPLYKDDNGNLGGYFTMVGGKRVALQGWSPAAAQSNGREVIESLRAQGRIDPDSMITRRTHERVMGGDGGQHWMPLARQSASDGRDAFWAYTAAGIPTDAVPKGGTPAFARGWNEARRGRGLLAGMAAVDATLGVLGAGAGAARGLRPSTRGAGPAGGPNMAWGARTQVVPSGRIEVSNGGRPLPPVRTGQPAGPGRPAAAPPAAAASRPLPPAAGGRGGGAIDVEAVTVSTRPVPRPTPQARPKPLPSAEVRRQPEAAPPRNQAVVRRAAEWPEAPPTPRPGQQGSPGRTQQPALAQGPRALPEANGRAGGPPALPQTVREAPAATNPGLEVAGAATRSTAPATPAAGNGISAGRWVVQQQPVQQPNQGPGGPERAMAPASREQASSTNEGTVNLGSLRGVVELPPERPADFALDRVAPEAVMKAIDQLEANPYPVSGPGFDRAAEPVFGNLFRALDALGSRKLTMSELQGLLDSKLHDPGVILRSPADFKLAFDPAKRLASPHEFHLFFGGFRGHTGPSLEAPLAGWGGENGLFARVTDEFDDQTPSNWGDAREIFALWTVKVFSHKNEMFGPVPDSHWASVKHDLTIAVDEGLDAELKAFRSKGVFADPRYRELYRPLVDQLKTTPPGSPARAEAANRLVESFRELDTMLRRGVPISGATAEVQLLETFQAYLKKHGLFGKPWRPDDSIDFGEMYELYMQLHDPGKLTTRERVRSAVESMGLQAMD